MKKIIKSNKIPLIFGLLLFCWALYGSFEYWQHTNKIKKLEVEQIEKCQGIYANDDNYKESCSLILSQGVSKPRDTFSIFFSIIGHYSISLLQMFGPIFIFAMAIFNFNQELKSGYYKNVLTRLEYKKYIKRSYFKSLKYILVYPIILLVIFILSFLMSGHFNILEGIKNEPGFLFINPKYISILPYFLFVYILNIMIHSVFWINISYMVVQKNKNFIVTVILSFIIYVALFIILEIFVGGLFFDYIFGFKGINAYFSLSNIWVYSQIDFLPGMVIISTIFALISLCFVYLTYKNKEKVIMNNEI